MQPAEPLLYAAVQVLVIEPSALPAHPADETDRFHIDGDSLPRAAGAGFRWGGEEEIPRFEESSRLGCPASLIRACGTSTSCDPTRRSLPSACAAPDHRGSSRASAAGARRHPPRSADPWDSR